MKCKCYNLTMPGYARPVQYYATGIQFTPAGNVSASTVQGAIQELDDEKATTGSVSAVSASVQPSSTKVLDVYASSSARSSALPSPSEGKLTYLQDTKNINVYNGTTWTEVSGGGGTVDLFFLMGA